LTSSILPITFHYCRLEVPHSGFLPSRIPLDLFPSPLSILLTSPTLGSTQLSQKVTSPVERGSYRQTSIDKPVTRVATKGLRGVSRGYVALHPSIVSGTALLGRPRFLS
jgi:hypothetical protein